MTTLTETELDAVRARWTPQDEIVARLEDEGAHKLAQYWRRTFDEGETWNLPCCVLCPSSDERMGVDGSRWARKGMPEYADWVCQARPERGCRLPNVVPRPYGYNAKGDVLDLVQLLDGCTREEAVGRVLKRLTSR